MDSSKPKRIAIRKLDFENCEITMVRTKRTYKKRLKAKIIHEFEDESYETTPSSRRSNSEGSVEEKDGSSPILYRKRLSQKRIPNSPVLVTKARKKLKINKESSPSTSAYSESRINAKSPVFVVKTRTREKVTIDHLNLSPENEVSVRETREKNAEIFTGVDSSPDAAMDFDDHSGKEYEIEEFSQELSKEGKEEMRISSFSSESKVESELQISQDQSYETDESFLHHTPINHEEEESPTDLEDEKKGKRPKKGGLVERLFNLRKREASEMRIREHKKKIMKTKEIWKKILRVAETWKEGSRLTLKCQQLQVSEGRITNFPTAEHVYLILHKNSNCFKKIKKGTLLRIAAPWHEVRPRAVDGSVLLSVTTFELMDSMAGTNSPKATLEEVSVAKYKEDESLLFDTLFACNANVFLS